MELSCLSADCLDAHLEIHVVVRADEEALVRQATPLELDDDLLARQLLEERLEARRGVELEVSLVIAFFSHACSLCLTFGFTGAKVDIFALRRVGRC